MVVRHKSPLWSDRIIGKLRICRRHDDWFLTFCGEILQSRWNYPLTLQALRPYRPAARPAEHLYRYFRGGIEHSFAIEWGGLRHREDGAPLSRRRDGTRMYLFE